MAQIDSATTTNGNPITNSIWGYGSTGGGSITNNVFAITGSPTITGIYYTSSLGRVYFILVKFGTSYAANTEWDFVRIGSTDFTRTGASATTYNPLAGSTTFFWNTGTNPFNTAGGGTTFVQWADSGGLPDIIPDQFSFTDVTGATRSTVYNTYDQITGLGAAAAVTVTSGSGTFSISNTTTPGTFGTTGNISNNQYLHVRQTSSSSYLTSVSTTYAISGSVSDTWQVTTEQNPDELYGVEIRAPNGNNVVFTPTKRTSNIGAAGTVSLVGAYGTATVSNIPDATSDQVKVVYYSGQSTWLVSYSKSSTSITFTKNSSLTSTLTVDYIIFRI